MQPKLCMILLIILHLQRQKAEQRGLRPAAFTPSSHVYFSQGPRKNVRTPRIQFKGRQWILTAIKCKDSLKAGVALYKGWCKRPWGSFVVISVLQIKWNWSEWRHKWMYSTDESCVAGLRATQTSNSCQRHNHVSVRPTEWMLISEFALT